MPPHVVAGARPDRSSVSSVSSAFVVSGRRRCPAGVSVAVVSMKSVGSSSSRNARNWSTSASIAASRPPGRPPIGRGQCAGFVEHCFGDEQRRLQTDCERNGIGGARVDPVLAGGAAEGEVGEERSVVEFGDFDGVEVAVERVDHAGHQVVGHRAGQSGAVGGEGDRAGIGLADDDRQQPVRGVVLTQHQRRSAADGIDLDSDEFDRDHDNMIQADSTLVNSRCHTRSGNTRCQGERRCAMPCRKNSIARPNGSEAASSSP